MTPEKELTKGQQASAAIVLFCFLGFLLTVVLWFIVEKVFPALD